jgi:hypothetical protein
MNLPVGKPLDAGDEHAGMTDRPGARRRKKNGIPAWVFAGEKTTSSRRGFSRDPEV